MTCLLFGVVASFVMANSSPVVSNVTANQRTDGSGIVDIYYTLSDADGDKCTVSVLVSSDSGSTWTITPSVSALSGAVSGNITSGRKQVTWASKTDLPGEYGSNYRIKVTANDLFQSGNYIYDTQWGDGQLSYPRGIDIATNGNIYVVSEYSHQVKVFSPNGTLIKTIIGANDFNYPSDIAIDQFGTFYVSNSPANDFKLMKFNLNGDLLAVWELGQRLWGVAVDSAGDIYVAMPWVNMIAKVRRTDGSIIKTITGGGTGLSFNFPGFVAVDSNDRVYVSDQNNKRIQIFTNDLTYIKHWNVNLTNPCAIDFDSNNNLFIADGNLNTFYMFSSDGVQLGRWGALGSNPGQFNEPSGIVVDSTNQIYIVDRFNNRVQRFVPIDSPVGMQFGIVAESDFTGSMSKYETTNAQYCQYLNAALAAKLIIVYNNQVYAASDTSHSYPYFGTYAYSSYSQITYSSGTFSVRSRDGYSMANHPVVMVSWYGATAFCDYYGFRLPTEWEWQAVADYDGSYTYGCGTTISQSKANYYNSGYANPLGLTSYPYTTPVGYYGAFGYGLCDMAGNVWEWTNSSSSSSRVHRGGGWTCYDAICAVSYRDYNAPYYMIHSIGFRVCR